MVSVIRGNEVSSNSVRESQIEIFRSMRRVSCPLAAFLSLDHTSLIKELCKDWLGNQGARITWDGIKGFLGINDEGIDYVKKFKDPNDTSLPSLLQDLLLLTGDEHTLPEKACLFIYNAHLYFEKSYTTRPLIIQQLQHFVNRFKAGHRTVVFCCSHLDIPIELEQDVILFNYNYPDDKEINDIIEKVYKMAKNENIPTDDFRHSVLPDLRGLSPKSVEQLVALSMRKEGINTAYLRQMREENLNKRGISVYKDNISFKDLGGLTPLKKHLKLLFNGRRPPEIIVWVDEIEKAIAGFEGDNTGTTQDQVKVLLEYMANYNFLGLIFLGLTGTGKSFAVKAIGQEFNRRVLAQDLGAAKQKELGMSEYHIRQHMELFRSMGRDRVLYIATCNDITKMPAEFLRRFKLGKYMFDLPNREEKQEIWKICKTKYGITDNLQPNDAGYSHSDINDVCEGSYLYNIPLLDASKYVQACDKLNTEKNRALRLYASSHGLMSSSYEGFYQMPKSENSSSNDAERIISFEDVN